jgi:hypothetical protein
MTSVYSNIDNQSSPKVKHIKQAISSVTITGLEIDQILVFNSQFDCLKPDFTDHQAWQEKLAYQCFLL